MENILQINDREYIKCNSDYCSRFRGPNNIPIDGAMIVEPDSFCKRCDHNAGTVEIFYKTA